MFKDGVEPHRADFMHWGDPPDKLPGARGVGAKGQQLAQWQADA
jgi:hypothetical protein